MSEDQDTIIQDQPLKVLGLFHKRQLKTIIFDQDKFLRLYDNLCCTICRQLFNNPVYLKCSHRFCKQCIEKYIRFNQKKSCPNCRSDLNTKRDLRNDFGLSTLINYAFGDRKKFCEQIQQIQNAEAVSFQRVNSKTLSIVRSKSFAEQQPKVTKKKVKQNQDMQSQSAQIKPKRKRGRPQINRAQHSSPKGQQNRIQNSPIPQSQATARIQARIQSRSVNEDEQKYRQSHQQNEKTQQLQGYRTVVKKKRGRKKQIPVIEIKSHQQQQIEEVRNQLQEVAGIVELEYKDTSCKIECEKVQKQPEKYPHDAQAGQDPFQKEKKCLKEQFGDHYMFKLMKVPILDFLIQIRLERHPDCYYTPQLLCRSIQVSSKTRVHNVFILLSKLLNVPTKNIQVYAKTQKLNQLNQINQLNYYQCHKKTLSQINEQLWKTVSGVQVFDMKQILSSLEQVRGQNSKSTQNLQNSRKCKLFQGMQTQKDSKQGPVKKRGRGRVRRMQEKQNIQVKQQFKRIFYYKLFVE